MHCKRSFGKLHFPEAIPHTWDQTRQTFRHITTTTQSSVLLLSPLFPPPLVSQSDRHIPISLIRKDTNKYRWAMQEHDHHRPLELVAAFGSLRDCNKFGAFSVLFRFPRRRWSSSGRGHFNLWICYCPTSALKTNLRVVPIHRDSRYVSKSIRCWLDRTNYCGDIL